MKKIIFLLCMLVPSISFGQYRYYKDSSYTQTFNFLTATTSVNNNNWWDDPEYAIPLGFTFHLFSDTTDTIHISQEVGLGALLSMHEVTPTTPFSSGIIAHGSDLVDRDTSGNNSFSPISYITSGTTPSRIFKLEWKNAGFFNPIDNGTSYADSINLQLWLYEGSDAVEVRFGNGNYVSSNNDLYDGGPGPLVGLFDSLNTTFDTRVIYYLKNATNSPSLDSMTSLTSLPFPPGMTGNPAAGSVYRFTPKQGGSTTTGFNTLTSVVSNDMNYYADRNELRIDIFSNDRFKYTIFDIQGKIVGNGAVSKGRNVVNTQSLSGGLFIVKLTSAKENATMKFVR
jgi:hypothetical protein